MDLSVRPATVDDLDELAELDALLRREFEKLRGGAVYLLRDHRPEPVRESYARALDDPATRLVVARVGPVAAGFGAATLQELHGGYVLADITEIFVLPELREVGVGAAIMSDLLHWARAAGADGIDSRTMPGDRETKNFFESNGLVARAILVHRDLREP